MLAIQGDLNETDARIIFDDTTGITGAQTGIIFPADRCTWQFQYNAADNQYELIRAAYSGNTEPGTARIARTYSIGNPVLGTIGKSGRFVPFTA